MAICLKLLEWSFTMPKVVIPLTDTEINKAKPKDKDYKLFDGEGLSIKITTIGRKIWLFDYYSPINGKRRTFTIGKYPTITLKEARFKKTELRAKVDKGIDPKEELKTKKINSLTLNTVIDEWLEIEKKSIHENTFKTKISRLQVHIIPKLGNRAIKSINHIELAEIIKEIGNETPPTAKIISQLLNRIFKFAVSSGYTDFNVMANVDTKTLIPRVKVEHYGKLTEKEDLKELFKAVYNYPFFESIKNALKLCLHIPLRAKPLSLIKWQYIDFKNRTITIPREDQKNKNKDLGNFILPLSDEVISILQDQAKLSRAYEYVFINQSFNSHIHKDSPTQMLKRLEFKDPLTNKPITLHSFRGIFMTYALEHKQDHGVSTEAIGKVLDHLHGNTVTLSYSEKTTFFDELKIILSYWSNEILKLKDER